MVEKKKKLGIRFKGFTDDWELRKLGELTNIASAARVHKEEWASFGVPFFRSSDVVSEYRGTENEKAFISYELYEQLSQISGKLEKDDILITGGGSIGIPYIVTNNEPLYSKDADLIWIKSSKNFNSKYLYTYFATSYFRSYVSSISHIGTIAHYTIEQVKNTPIYVPSYDEQEKIGLFFQNLDRLIALHQRKYDKLINVKKAMLKKMFPKNGSNVPEIRFNGFTDDWERRKLSELCIKFTDGDWIEAKDQSNEGVRLIQTGNVGVTRYLDKSSNQKWISEDTFERLHCEEIFPGDILISRLPEPAGRACIMPDLGKKMITAVDCTIVRIKPEVSNKYLVQYLSTDDYFKEVNTCLAGGTRQRISRSNLSEFIVPMPKDDIEQKQIGQFFENLDNLSTLHQRELEKLKNVKKACLEKMFL